MDNDNEKTLYCGNLSEKVTEDILYELFLQAGPLESVKIPKDKDGRYRNFAFIKFRDEESVPYTIALFSTTKLFGRPLQLKARQGSKAMNAPNPYMEKLDAHFASVHQAQPQRHNMDTNRVWMAHPQAQAMRFQEQFPHNSGHIPSLMGSFPIQGAQFGNFMSPHYNYRGLQNPQGIGGLNQRGYYDQLQLSQQRILQSAYVVGQALQQQNLQNYRNQQNYRRY